jgi:hypothetical protein
MTELYEAALGRISASEKRRERSASGDAALELAHHTRRGIMRMCRSGAGRSSQVS